MTERFFILTPTPTGHRGKDHGGNEHTIYLDASGKEMFWSADFAIPSIGQRIFITMNSIGWAVVKGYFVSETDTDNYVGVMTLATRPPKWLRDQHKRDLKHGFFGSGSPMPQWMKDGIGCEFGTEIALKRPSKRKVAA